ncbi:MAG: stage V sporulation protein AD [bacterium]|nr:stage V sporulation protein AD [bacterium]
MTYKYNKVYLQDSSTVSGPYEKEGPLGSKFDKTYDNLYNGEKTWEKAEAKLLQESIDILLSKTNKTKNDIDLIISGDLLNQVTSSSYAVSKYDRPFLGVYSACASNVEGMIIASTMIDSGKIDNCIVSTSSHNMSSEKQFRNPTEYGAPKPDTATFTSTGGASCLLTNEKTDIRIESTTIGTVVDLGQNDPLNMGAVMAPAAADTIYKHLATLNRNVNYYDLILTGDLGTYGKQILIDYMISEYGIDIKNNYNDMGTMLYDLDKQKQVKAGGSGPVCSALVLYSQIIPMLKKKQIKRVLIVATGALFSPTFVYQHENINAISHAVSLEAI